MKNIFYKKLNLILYPILATVLFFSIPFYNNWLYTKVLNNNFLFEASHMDMEARNEQRFGFSYTVYRDIKKTLQNKSNVTLLLPPNDYVKSRHVDDLIIPEPAVFYYFTGIKSVWPKSPDAASANWVMLVSGPGNMSVNKMSYIKKPDSLLADYKRYQK